MIHKTLSPVANHVRLTFELPDSLWADQVFLVGDFNQWSLTATPFAQTRAGTWLATVDLPTGISCAFRYLIDGRWLTDFNADGSTSDSNGLYNSVVNARLHPFPI